tara:strand:+ start:7496 stop:8068 length:573 start_codon:yes stop_codon:yes gene_type:complete
MTVGVNDFVRRQVKGSGKTYAKTMSFSEIAKHAERQMSKNNFIEGYRVGVRRVKAPKVILNDFVCPFVRINEETKMISKVVRRSKNEEPYVQIRALNGTPLIAGKVEFILYRRDVLIENSENTTNEDWELISINAIPKGLEYLPMGPVTMMRNQLNLVGGTKAVYSSKEWAESVQFWQKFAPLEPNKELT